MKYTLIMSLLFSVLISCDTTDKPATEHTNELVQQFKPFLHGVWVPSDYVEAIEKTKSPLKSSEKINFISTFIIDTSDINADSLIVRMGLGNHEGGEFTLYFRQGQYQNTLQTDIIGFEDNSPSHDLGYVITSDTSLVLYHYNENKELLDQTNYIKVRRAHPGNDLGDGFQYIVNQKLVAGVYKVTDSTGKEMNVTLLDDGTITGFPEFKTYYIITDFVAEDPEDASDSICFDIQTENQKCYGFKINGDTINLFTEPREPDTLSTLALQVYQFVKQR